MYAYVILSLLMALVAMEVGADRPPPSPIAALGGAAVAAVVVLGAGLAISAYILWRRGALEKDEQRFLRRVGLLGKTYRLFVVLAYATILFGLGWPALAAECTGPVGWVMPPLALTLAPLVLLLLVAWTALYWADRHLRALMFQRAGGPVQHWTLPRYLEFMSRQYLIVILLPVLALLAVADVVQHFLGPPEGHPLTAALLAAVALGSVLMAGPWVRFCWRTEPLPDGELRRRLLALAERARIRVANILVWRTNLSIANGCMIGVVGPLRYIMVTDVLLLSLAPQEVESVFAHEVAHVKYRHVWLYLLMALAGLCLATLAGEAAMGLSRAEGAGYAAVGLVILAYWWIAFGFVSRRCEQECDLYAVRATACPVGCSPPDAGVTMRDGQEGLPAEAALAAAPSDAGEGPADAAVQAPEEAVPWAGICEHRVVTFVAALRRIARLNGSAETARGWRHFSIARRCRFLLDVLADPGEARRHERRTRRLKVAVLVLALTVGIAAAAFFMAPGGADSEPDEPQNPAGPEDVPPSENTQLVRFVDRDQVDLIALRPPEFHRDAHPAAHLDDGRLPRLGLGSAVGHDDVAVADARRHAVPVNAEGERAARHAADARRLQELDEAFRRGRG